jgi:hypothetical protein
MAGRRLLRKSQHPKDSKNLGKGEAAARKREKT